MRDSRVLDLDPSLGAKIARGDWPEARLSCDGIVVTVPRGHWTPSEAEASLGWVVVAGLLSRETALADRVLVEILGPRSVLGRSAEHFAGGHVSSTVTVERTSTLVGLGASFARAADAWPSLMTTLLARYQAQNKRLAMQRLIGGFPEVSTRILLTMAQLTGPWGEETPEGIRLTIPLTSEFVSRVITAPRTTVTRALDTLQSEGLITSVGPSRWRVESAGVAAARVLLQSGRPGGRAPYEGPRGPRPLSKPRFTPPSEDRRRSRPRRGTATWSHWH